MDENFDIVFGLRHGWGQDSPFGLFNEDWRHHTYIVGKTGTGKTTLLRNLIIHDIDAGHGLSVL